MSLARDGDGARTAAGTVPGARRGARRAPQPGHPHVADVAPRSGDEARAAAKTGLPLAGMGLLGQPGAAPGRPLRAARRAARSSEDTPARDGDVAPMQRGWARSVAGTHPPRQPTRPLRQPARRQHAPGTALAGQHPAHGSRDGSHGLRWRPWHGSRSRPSHAARGGRHGPPALRDRSPPSRPAPTPGDGTFNGVYRSRHTGSSPAGTAHIAETVRIPSGRPCPGMAWAPVAGTLGRTYSRCYVVTMPHTTPMKAGDGSKGWR